MVKVLDGGIDVRRFELQSRYYVHSKTSTLWKGRNLYNPQQFVLVLLLIIYKDSFVIKYPIQVDLPLHKETKPKDYFLCYCIHTWCFQ